MHDSPNSVICYALFMLFMLYDMLCFVCYVFCVFQIVCVYDSLIDVHLYKFFLCLPINKAHSNHISIYWKTKDSITVEDI